MLTDTHPPFFNFSVDVIDRQAAEQDKLALIWASAEGRERQFNFTDIARLSAKLAGSLSRAGLRKGDRVIVMLPRIPEWQIAMVACLRLGLVAIPCIEMLTAKDIAYRVASAGARGVITTCAQCAKFDAVKDQLAVRIALDAEDDWLDLSELVVSGDDHVGPAAVAAEDPAILYFTSGSTGQPKGVLHAARALYHWRHSAIEWLGLTARDLIWCTADTGWSKAGTSILFGPWSCGAAVFFYDGPFDAQQRLALLERHKISVFCASGTEILRILDQPMGAFDLSHLRRTVSAGETLSESAARKWKERTDHDVAEAYGQTESLMTVGYPSGRERRPGAMGVPLGRNDLAVIDDKGTILPSGTIGELALRGPNPQLMLGYWNDPERTAACYINGPDGHWFRTGDRAEQDVEGYLYHRGRGDDVINSSGYRIGPAEVEDILLQHPAVLEVAVVGGPDAQRGEIVVAYVVLRANMVGDTTLIAALQDFVRKQTAPYKYPRAIRFVSDLPKTPTGKIQRSLLREQESRRLDV